MAEPRRKLGFHDRYSLARRNLRFTKVVSFIITYPSASARPSRGWLSQRIIEMQEHFPLLWAEVRDHHTPEPYLCARAEPWKPEEVLREGAYERNERPRKEKWRILHEEQERMAGEELNTRPGWQVTLYDVEEGGPAYLGFSIDHIFFDGMGTLRTLQTLLAESITELPVEKLEEITTLENSVDIRPRYAKLVPVALRSLALPKLPTFLQSWFAETETWPGKKILQPPLQSAFGSALVEVSAETMSALKTLGKQKGIATVHPVLKMACLVALWAVFRKGDNPLNLIGMTPASLRSRRLGHSHINGNYVTNAECPVALSSNTDFWAVTKSMADYLRSPIGIADSKGSMGMMAFIPNNTSTSPGPTGWEDFFHSKAQSPSPHASAMELSNLGFATLPNGASDMAWNQNAMPFGPAMAFSSIGHEAGLRVSISWREGVVGSEREMKEVEEVLGRVLDELAEGEKSVLKDLI